MDDEHRESWAQFRFDVIAPLLDEKLDSAEKARIRRDILTRTYITPDSKKWRISERTLRSWLTRYRNGQVTDLENRRKKNRGEMKALDETVLLIASGLRKRLRSRSIQDIKMHLKIVHGLDVSKISSSTLNRHLNRIGASKDKTYSELGIFQRFQKEHINQTWQSDCSDGIYLPDPHGLKRMCKTTLITCIDDASRFCVHGQFYFTARLEDLLDCLRTGFTSRGRPTKLYCDNGAIYCASDLARICSALGIGIEHSEVNHPEGKGKQERHYLTIQRRFYREAEKAGLATLQELNEFFWAWLDECYHKVEHSELKMTPLERWQMEESQIVRLSIEEINEAMQLRARRTVNKKTALIQLNGQRYQASRNLAGLRVQVRWPFDDKSFVDIWRDGAFCERADLFKPNADIDYSKRPHRAEKEEPKALDCAKQFRAALVAKFRGEKAPEETSHQGFLTEREFTLVVEQCLGRKLVEAEMGVLSRAYKQLYPVDAHFIERSLAKAIAGKGNGMHITFYVKCLQEYKQNGGN